MIIEAGTDRASEPMSTQHAENLLTLIEAEGPISLISSHVKDEARTVNPELESHQEK